MKVLVTGGAGYIGSHVVQLLTERDYEVVVFDNLIKGNRGAVHPDATLIVGDLHDRSALADLFQAISSTASCTSPRRSWSARACGSPSTTCAIISIPSSMCSSAPASTASSASSCPPPPISTTTPERVPIDESEALIPGSIYGETKYMAERLLAWMDRLYGIKYCCLRYFNACGAHPDGHIGEAHDPESHLIPARPAASPWASARRSKSTAPTTTRPMAPASAIMCMCSIWRAPTSLALEALVDGESRVYNLGSGSGYSVREVIEAARKVTGHAIPTIRSAPPPRRPARPGRR